MNGRNYIPKRFIVRSTHYGYKPLVLHMGLMSLSKAATKFPGHDVILEYQQKEIYYDSDSGKESTGWRTKYSERLSK